MKVAIIGAGNIGKELYKKTQQLGWSVSVIVKKDAVYKDLENKLDKPDNYQKYCNGLDIAFLCIPTADDGKTM